jgi:ADP-dependent NAD(P)H-hydrate dehydratase / NAD(P)H-hydrate epimerase
MPRRAPQEVPRLASLLVEELPAWLTPLPDAETMRAVDRWAIEEQGIPGLDLMERAGAAVARAVERIAPDSPVTVVCGKGNNGGDGLVVARLLREAGHEVDVVCAASPEEFKGDAAANLERLPGPGPVRLDGRSWDGGDRRRQRPFEHPAAIVDAVLGTGFSGTPHGEAAEAIDAIERADAPVVSVDVPSGVDASTGAIDGEAVCAAGTVTFHAAKPGLWIRPGKDHAGTVEIADIGIPRGAPMQARVGLIDASVLSLLPRRAGASTKFISGHVLIAGGSIGLTGAPAMAARAAMRAGAGYVTVFVPAAVQPVLASGGVPEVMFRAMPEVQGALDDSGVEQVLGATRRGGALALGPGLGTEEGAALFARRLARAARVPLVLDADGLNAHARRPEELSGRTAPTVLTPHAGELGRLLDRDSAEIERDRLRYAVHMARRSGAVVVLKGDDTLVAEPGGVVAVSPGGSPALATAGTGDVLSGVIAAGLSQRLDPFTAAAAGVLLHARAGRLAARRVGAAEAVIASDVIEALGHARTHDDERAL